MSSESPELSDLLASADDKTNQTAQSRAEAVSPSSWGEAERVTAVSPQGHGQGPPTHRGCAPAAAARVFGTWPGRAAGCAPGVSHGGQPVPSDVTPSCVLQ